jgi:hypothetical protein
LSVQNIVAAKSLLTSRHSSAVQHLRRNRCDLLFNPRCLMTKISALATATALASLLLMGGAFAQTTAPAKTEAPKMEAPKTEAAKEAKPRTAASLECSKEADAKGLKGKERKKFRSECKKAAADKAK